MRRWRRSGSQVLEREKGTQRRQLIIMLGMKGSPTIAVCCAPHRGNRSQKYPRDAFGDFAAKRVAGRWWLLTFPGVADRSLEARVPYPRLIALTAARYLVCHRIFIERAWKLLHYLFGQEPPCSVFSSARFSGRGTMLVHSCLLPGRSRLCRSGEKLLFFGIFL